MKKLILALTTVLLLSPGAYSQKKAPVIFPSNEIGISYGCGYNTADKMFDDMDSFYNVTIADEFFEAIFKDVGVTSHMVASLDYMRAITPRISVGAAAGYGWQDKTTRRTENDVAQSVKYTTKVKSKVAYLLPQARYIWYASQSKVIRLYSKVALGVVWQDVNGSSDDPRFDVKEKSDVKWKPAFQVMAFGIDLGWEKFRFFNELGYGCQGFSNFGVRYIFN
jgi:hypothetical protein